MRLFSIIVNVVVLAVVLAVPFFFFRETSEVIIAQVIQEFAPCSKPITYRIGAIDPKFGISREQVLSDVEAAAKIWNSAADRELFAHDEKYGSVVIGFEYDVRQETTQKLNKLGIIVNDDRETYESVKVRYDAMFNDYREKSSEFRAAVSALQSRQDAYVRAVSTWNGRGGAPKDVYAQLQSEKEALNAESSRLKAVESSINADVANVNALASELNHLIEVLNLDVEKYNSTGAKSGAEFEEAVYVRSLGRESITVYEYDSNQRLVRVLAHELGHALGLEHVEDPKAIMFELNQSSNDTPTDVDMSALSAQCRPKPLNSFLSWPNRVV